MPPMPLVITVSPGTRSANHAVVPRALHHYGDGRFRIDHSRDFAPCCADLRNPADKPVRTNHGHVNINALIPSGINGENPKINIR